MQNILKIFILALISSVLFSCGTKKNVTTRKAEENKVNVIKKNKASEPDFKTLQGRLRGSYDDGEESQSISVSIRMEKDKAIWLSAKLAGIIPLAKVLVEPNRVQFYEKINGKYFDGDFSLLSSWLNTELDFQKVQDLLIGQPIYEPTIKEYQLSSTQNGYQLASIEKSPIAKSFLIDLLTYRTKAQQLIRASENQGVTITYDDFLEKKSILCQKESLLLLTKKNRPQK